MSQSVSAIIRCRKRGVMWKDSPGPRTRSASVSPSAPVWKRMRPLKTWTVSSFLRWYCRLSAWPCLMWRILPTYRSVRAQISSWPQGFSTRNGFCSAIATSPGRHHHGRTAHVALDVGAESARGRLVLEGADAHAVPRALAAEVGLDHVRLETGGAGLALHPLRFGPILRGADLHGEFAHVVRRRREHYRHDRCDLDRRRRSGNHRGRPRRRHHRRRPPLNVLVLVLFLVLAFDLFLVLLFLFVFRSSLHGKRRHPRRRR